MEKTSIMRDVSMSAVVAGFIATIVSYAGPLLIVFQAAKVANLGDAYVSSWIWAISLGSGLTCLLLSIWFRSPVITAWSTPGLVLLVSSWSAYSYSDAIGAFVFSAVMVTILGVTGVFSAVMNRIPYAITTAMLAGILLKFGIEVFVSLQKLPTLVLPMIVCYLVAKRFLPRYAVALTLCVGLLLAYGLTEFTFSTIHAAMVKPVFTKPTFSFDAIIGLGIPLCVVAMASQNAPGIGVLRADGYNTPINPLITTTGIASLLFAPFGSHGINLAAITAAICTGKEAHHDSRKRYIAGISCGVFYIIFGTFGATISSLVSSLPGELIAVLAGLALFASLSASLASAMKEEAQRESALITFLVTISGISIAGIGSAFWGLIAGVVTSFILTGDVRTALRKKSRAA
ncbi:benzoate/H(+) symporter BenE family transporter [Aneurinibacillus uraniidurans]|uniref:benzoate/H(+) symporter BenE family transporter n=1 Tax=Aneurinibacillus uraniidurans TaxID=2966586 RepID=UPI0023491469|nr:benzoate/H(+) symporter BenE family transporter [Aneurinibacillus sp. B1]WCN39255.1 benzoate/H(+) symporter BenE family transporter [Aneurinibacillus sp. B1]